MVLVGLLSAVAAFAAPATAAEGPALDVLVEICTQADDNVDDCDVADDSMWRGNRMVAYGSDLRWRVTAQNIGDEVLSDVATVAAGVPSCAGLAIVPTLAPGDDASVTCDIADVVEPAVNLVSIEATTAAGDTIGKTRHGTLYIRPAVYALSSVLEGCSPAASCDAAEATWSSDHSFVEGADSAWRLVLTNDGSRPLADVTTDAAELGCSFPAVAALAIGETATIGCDATITHVEDIAVTATSSGIGPDGDIATATASAAARVDFASVLHGIDVCKQNSVEACDPTDDGNFGESATFDWNEPGIWRVFVENTGTVDLVDLSVVGSAEPDCDRAVGDDPALDRLAPGERYTYLCVTPGMHQSMVSSGSAYGIAPDGSTAGDLDVARTYLRGATLAMDVVASVCATSGEVPCTSAEEFGEALDVLAGSEVVVRAEITNNGNRPLVDIVVETPFGAACIGDPLSEVAAGSTGVYLCTVEAVQPSDGSTVTVRAAEPNGGEISQTSTADVNVSALGFAFGVCVGSCDDSDDADWSSSIEVDADQATNYRIAITNSFGESVAGVVEVPGLEHCLTDGVLSVALLPGESTVVVCTDVSIAAVERTASVTVSAEALGTIEQAASVSITLAPIDLVVELFPPSTPVVPGTPAFALVSVSNASAATAKDVQLSLVLPAGVQFVTRGFTPDPDQPGALVTTIGELQAGQASTQTILMLTDSNFDATEPLVMSASARGLQDDLDESNNAQSVVIPIDEPIATFAVFVEGVVDVHEVGDIVTQDVLIENEGPSDLATSVSIVIPSTTVLVEVPEGCTQLGTLRCDTSVITAGDIYTIPLVLEVVAAGTIGLSGAVGSY